MEGSRETKSGTLAQQAMTMPRILIPLVCAIPALLVVVLLHSPVTTLEDQFTALKYQLRGEILPDSNIVIVYIDNDAISSLGWPVRRNFYALMVNALSELGVRTIGIDVHFEVPSMEYPEYDDLLVSVIRSSKRVVLPSYFQTIEEERNGFQRGLDLRLPMRRLLAVAAGTGHANTVDGYSIPAVLQSGDSIVPAFGVEMARIALDGRIVTVPDAVHLTRDGATSAIPTTAGGVVHLNFPPHFSTFRSYPFLEVLKSYDAVRQDQSPSVPVHSFRNKIVLLGIIGEGRSEFFSTPVDDRFPAIGLHAVVIDNVLHNRFLTETPVWIVYLMALLLGVCCAAAILFLQAASRRVTVLLCILVPLIISLALFTASATMVPFIPVAAVLLLSGFAAQIYKHRLTKREIDSLTAEKASITSRLRDKEAKLSVLERELLDANAQRSADRTQELLDEVHRYKAEIRVLSSRADDMVEYNIRTAAQETRPAGFEGMVYSENGRMKQVVDFVSKIAGSDAPVLILGESGTGKELVAQAIHRRGNRRERQFVAVNCGALAENLLESELFGHEKGAFTGAVRERIGRFELADGGTIFLDEIGEVSEGFQLKLLRVLQQGEFERVGATKTLKVDVRVLAATNKDLKEQVKEKQFREDLYYRLNVLQIALPPLRERQEDIPLLIQHFLAREDGALAVSKNVMESLVAYPWPGNIRELESVIKRAALLARAEKRTMVTMKDLSEEISTAVSGAVEVEEQILAALREKGFSRNSVSETADELGGLNRGTVAEYLRGQCLKVFVESGFDLEKAVFAISLSTDSAVNDRVRKKFAEYLRNLSEVIDLSVPWEQTVPVLRPKTKNLPQRYHAFLHQVGEAFYRGRWKLPAQ
jgi:DNA-binding NtrC family response regulator/CHASE2 domain-containing sensor protein